MAMHLERVGGRFVAAMAVLLAVAGNVAFAQEHKTYRCKVADVVRLDDNGRLHSDSNPKDILRQRFDGVIIDTLPRNDYREYLKMIADETESGTARLG